MDVRGPEYRQASLNIRWNYSLKMGKFTENIPPIIVELQLIYAKFIYESK